MGLKQALNNLTNTFTLGLFMKAFVATSLRNVPEALKITSLLEQYSIDHQCAITEIGSLKNRELFEHNVQGILDADIFITICKNLGRDTSVEAGIAYALGKRRIAVMYDDDNPYPYDIMVQHAVGEIVKEEKLPKILEGITQNGDSYLEFFVPNLKKYSTNVFKDLTKVFETQRFVDGEYVRKLEKTLADRYGRYVVTTSTGTSGLIIALDSILPNESDKKEVLVPSLTFPATIQAILHAGAKPIYVDVKEDSWNMDYEDAERKITDKTAAILPVNLFGIPCDIKSFENLSQKYNIPIIYDSCVAFGAKTPYGEVGRFGEAEVFSLDATKIVGAGLGGYVTTPDEALARKLKMAKNFGSDEQRSPQQRGINARMLEFSAILSLYSLEDSNSNLIELRERALKYRRYVKDIENLLFQSEPEGSIPSHQFFAIAIDDPKYELIHKTKKRLEERKIGSRIYVPKMLHLDENFSGGVYHLPVTEKIAPNILCLPMHGGVKDYHMQIIADTIRGELK